MNFLAHFHLAWPDEYLLAGALEGDYFKGPLPGELPERLVPGVKLHRAIDAFTDSHPRLLEAKRCFPPDARRYAGIAMDLCFDHFLAQHWGRYADLSLAEFSDRVYRVLSQHQELLSPRAATMAGRIVEHDLLQRYRDWQTIEASARRLGARLRRENPLQQPGEWLPPLLPELEGVFAVFYPELTRALGASKLPTGQTNGSH